MNELKINLKPFRKYRNVFYYLFHYSLLISLIPFLLGVLIVFYLSITVGFFLVISVFIYDFIIFELIEMYLWKRNRSSRRFNELKTIKFNDFSTGKDVSKNVGLQIYSSEKKEDNKESE